MRLKHNKKRNTAFLYEMLTREVVKSIIKKDLKKRNVTISLIKENFAKNTELRKELDLYKALLKTKNISLRTAEKLLKEVKKAHSALDKQKLFKEQSDLIKLINKNLSKETFLNFVPNYKDLATISQIFDEDVVAKPRVILEESVIKSITARHDEKKEGSDVSNLTIKSFISKFNEAYDVLLEEQRSLLNKYILSFKDNGVEFKMFLNEEIYRLRDSVEGSLNLQEVKEDKLLTDKTKGVLETIDGFKEHPINEGMLKQVLKIQSLVREIQN
jgi:hypothetical protein